MVHRARQMVVASSAAKFKAVQLQAKEAMAKIQSDLLR